MSQGQERLPMSALKQLIIQIKIMCKRPKHMVDLKNNNKTPIKRKITGRKNRRQDEKSL